MAKTAPSIAVVIASCRKESLDRWLGEWRDEFADIPVILVEDNPVKTFNPDPYHHYDNLQHYAWDDIDYDLRENAWIIPRRTSAVKSYGFWVAREYDIIWTLDDDCYPEEQQFKGRYLQIMQNSLSSDHWDKPWFNTIGSTGLYPRGYPYGIRHETVPVMLHHGLWSGVPDLDGITALEYYNTRMLSSIGHTDFVPRGQMFPMCGMNLAFRKELLPAMHFGLQGSFFSQERLGCEAPEPLPFDRFDDIWAGLFVKKICDHFNYAVASGAPSIVHTKESDPTMRVLKEAPGIAANEHIWPLVAGWDLRESKTVKEAYESLASCVYSFQHDPVLKRWGAYWVQLSNAMQLWTELF